MGGAVNLVGLGWASVPPAIQTDGFYKDATSESVQNKEEQQEQSQFTHLYKYIYIQNHIMFEMQKQAMRCHALPCVTLLQPQTITCMFLHFMTGSTELLSACSKVTQIKDDGKLS